MSAWRPKKPKELTKDEAIALAKQELAPYWHKVSPLFAGVRTETGVNAFPLEPLFEDGALALVFADPTDFSGELATHFAREYHKRYQVYDLRILLVLKCTYGFLKDRAAVEDYIERHQLIFPVALDHDGSLFQAFRATDGPRVTLLSPKGTAFEASGPNWFHEGELGIQRFLRSTDHGLPLLPILNISDTQPRDVNRLEFGRDRGLNYPAPGFGVQQGAYWLADFPEGGSATMSDGVPFAISGKWIQDQDRIATSDPKAHISLHVPSPGMAIVAQPLSKSVEGGRIVLEVNGIPAPDLFGDEGMSFDDEGHSAVRTDGPRLYRALKKLSAKERNVTLRFPFADRVPVALYGIRFWTSGQKG